MFGKRPKTNVLNTFQNNLYVRENTITTLNVLGTFLKRFERSGPNQNLLKKVLCKKSYDKLVTSCFTVHFGVQGCEWEF